MAVIWVNIKIRMANRSVGLASLVCDFFFGIDRSIHCFSCPCLILRFFVGFAVALDFIRISAANRSVLCSVRNCCVLCAFI